MPNGPQLNKVRSVLGGYAQLCLDDLKRAGEGDPYPESALASAAGRLVLVVTLPAPDGNAIPPGLTRCELHCLGLLIEAPHELSAACIRRELERRRVEIYGIATVKRALLRMKDLRLLVPSTKGYTPAFKMPLFDWARL
jgi:hypothetical protein